MRNLTRSMLGLAVSASGGGDRLTRRCKSRVAHMHIYRCFFLNEGGHIKAAEIIEADALSEVIDKALVMLRERPQH